MHENEVVSKIFSTVNEYINKNQELRSIDIDVGEYSCINTKTLQVSFEIAKQNSFAQNAKLIIHKKKNNKDINIRSIDIV